MRVLLFLSFICSSLSDEGGTHAPAEGGHETHAPDGGHHETHAPNSNLIEGGECIAQLRPGCESCGELCNEGDFCEPCCESTQNETLANHSNLPCDECKKTSCLCLEKCHENDCFRTEPVHVPHLVACDYWEEQSCCTNNMSELITHDLAALRAFYPRCEGCNRGWERVLCAANCGPQQAQIVEKDARDTHHSTIYLCSDLCESLYHACGEEEILPNAPGEGGGHGGDGAHGEDAAHGEEHEVRLPVTDVFKADYIGFCESQNEVFSLFLGKVTIEVVSNSERACLSQDDLGLVTEDRHEIDGLEVGDRFRILQYCPHNEQALHSMTQHLIFTFLGLGCAILFANIIEHYLHVELIPESAVVILIGAIAGAINNSQAYDFPNSFFQLILLPPIIFISGYDLRQKRFLKNLDSILTHAVFGTLIATFIIFGLLVATKDVWEPKETSLRVTNQDILVFASLISAVDPVATLATFSAVGVDRELDIKVFGEALINDAVAIVLFSTFKEFEAQTDVGEHTDMGTVASQATLAFFKVNFGSIGLGIAMGMAMSLIFKYIRFADGHEIMEVATFIALSWLAFLSGEAAGFSGIITCLVCGMMCEHYTYRNLSPAGKEKSLEVYKFIAGAADITIFFLIGVLAVEAQVIAEVSWPLVGLTFIFMLLARAIALFPLAAIVNLRRKVEDKVPWSHSIMMWLSGLRGAIAVALALQMPSLHRGLFVASTVYVAILSVFIFGTATRPMLKFLKIDTNVACDPKLVVIHDEDINSLRGWQYIDNFYVKACLIRSEEFLSPTAKAAVIAKRPKGLRGSSSNSDVEMSPVIHDDELPK